MSRWTDAQDRDCRSLAAARFSASEIGVKIGKTRNAIIGHCNRHGIALLVKKGDRQAIPPDTQDHIKRLRREGLTYSQIRDMTGHSSYAISRYS